MSLATLADFGRKEKKNPEKVFGMSTKVVTSLKCHPSDLGQLYITSEDVKFREDSLPSQLFSVSG